MFSGVCIVVSDGDVDPGIDRVVVPELGTTFAIVEETSTCPALPFGPLH